MDKRSLTKSMEDFTGAAFINQSQLAKYLKRSRTAIPELTYGIDYLQTGREKKYFIPDIAEKLMSVKLIG